MKETATLAIVGATGLVGREILAVLAERQFPIDDLRLYASARTAGERIECGTLEPRVDLVESASFAGVDIVFLAASEAISAELAPRAGEDGAVAIDLSQVFADDPSVPMIVPEVNAADVATYGERGIIGSPDSAATVLSVVLNPLRDTAGLRRVVATTFEPASTAGRMGIEDLQRQTIDLLSGRSSDGSSFPHRLAFNVFPQMGEFLEGGLARPERLTADALRRLLDFEDLPVSVTRVRVPLFFGQAISLHVETEHPLSAEAARALLREAPGILLQDEIGEAGYPTPADAVSQDATCVGRIRADEAAGTLDLWIATDNLRKGSAVNAVQIAEILLRDYL